MPVLKVKKNGVWEELGGTSPMDGGNADTLDGKHASEFASATDIKTLTQHLAEEDMILSSRQYGDTLPDPGIPGRIFFLKVSG